MIESPKNFIEQFQNFIEHIAGVMKTFLTKEVADKYYLGKTAKATSANTADTATKATQDANGNVIPETYATKSELTSGLATKQPVGDYRTKSELDSIYLGINAKAKSAETADTADTVKSIDTQAVVDGIGLVGRPTVNINIGLTATKQLTFTATQTGIATLDIYNSNNQGYEVPITISVNGTNYASGTTSEGTLATIQVFLNKGDVVKATSGYNISQSMRLTGYITPILFVAKEVTE